jgi:beta-glucosidase
MNNSSFAGSLLALLALLHATNVWGKEPDTIPALKPEVQTAAWAQSWWMPRHEEKIAERKKMDRVDLLMIGDSITHGWENAGRTTWDRYYAKRHALNLGFSGDRTEQVLWRFAHGEIDDISPKLAIVMIGTNNAGHRQDPPEQTAAGIKAIVGQLRTRLPETKVLLLAIFPRGENKDDSLRQLNRATNEIIADLADDQHVFFLDINSRFLEDGGTLPQAIMPDRLHPNEKGYAIWAEAMESTVKRLMGEGGAGG